MAEEKTPPDAPVFPQPSLGPTGDEQNEAAFDKQQKENAPKVRKKAKSDSRRKR